MPRGTIYNYGYDHQRKEVVVNFRIGSSPPIEIIMSAEAFLFDLEFMANDQKLKHFISEVKKRKDLPVDYDFGVGGSEIKFDPKEWEGKMGVD